MKDFFRKPVMVKCAQWLGYDSLTELVRPITQDEYYGACQHLVKTAADFEKIATASEFHKIIMGVVISTKRQPGDKTKVVNQGDWIIVFPNGEVKVRSPEKFVSEFASLDCDGSAPPAYNVKVPFDNGH